MFMGAVELESITFFFFWDGGLSRQIGIHESLDITKKKTISHIASIVKYFLQRNENAKIFESFKNFMIYGSFSIF